MADPRPVPISSFRLAGWDAVRRHDGTARGAVYASIEACIGGIQTFVCKTWHKIRQGYFWAFLVVAMAASNIVSPILDMLGRADIALWINVCVGVCGMLVGCFKLYALPDPVQPAAS